MPHPCGFEGAISEPYPTFWAVRDFAARMPVCSARRPVLATDSSCRQMFSWQLDLESMCRVFISLQPILHVPKLNCRAFKKLRLLLRNIRGGACEEGLMVLAVSTLGLWTLRLYTVRPIALANRRCHNEHRRRKCQETKPLPSVSNKRRADSGFGKRSTPHPAGGRS